MYEQLEPGVFVVRYAAAADMAPARQVPLVATVEAAARTGATALVFVIAPEVRSVEMAVPAFWLDATKGSRLGLVALAVVSRSSGVRLATVGFGAANMVRRVKLAVRGFEAERDAVAWASGAVRGRRGAVPG